MKILLTAINAKYIHSNVAGHNLQAYARKYLGQETAVEIAEYTINHPIGDILEGIYKERPDVLCFSCYIWNMRYVAELMQEYHKLCPDVPICVGGPEASYETEDFLAEHPEITGIMVGEGEQTFLELCRHYEEEKDTDALAEIAGIVYRRGEEICHTKVRARVDVCEIPFCYGQIEDFKNRIIY